MYEYINVGKRTRTNENEVHEGSDGIDTQGGMGNRYQKAEGRGEDVCVVKGEQQETK